MSNDDYEMEAMLEIFNHETEEMLEQLDNILLESERSRNITDENINSIFRITHTIKGSAAMMDLHSISSLAHSVEDVFYILRENPSKLTLVFDSIFDLVFQASDFFKRELESLQGAEPGGDPSKIISQLEQQAGVIKGDKPSDSGGKVSPELPQTAVENASATKILVFFDDDCGMENIRAFMLLNQVRPYCQELSSFPANPENDSTLAEEIVKNGFTLIFTSSESRDDVVNVIESSLNIKSYEILKDSPALDAGGSLSQAEMADKPPTSGNTATADGQSKPEAQSALLKGVKQNLISVNQNKLDHLMDLVGEIVTAESMVARNPDLNGLQLDNFTKSIRELRKLTDELQDIVMSIRMVPLQGTFYKMDRIVRDMSKKLDKKIELITEGGHTEVDKTINDAIVDPLMHMIRNSVDHAIESPEERRDLGKPEVGQITLSAKNIGGEISIVISDDGCGLDSEKLLRKAKENGLLSKPESSYSEKEMFNLILLPGFSTNAAVSEYSGRGVGMDVVKKNIEQVGGTISITSELGAGTTFTITIPLTLAIVDGMNISVGDSIFTIPITAINQSFKVNEESEIIYNPDGSEMIVIRGECLPIIRLRDLFGLESGYQDLADGILIQLERNNSSGYCISVDELIGEYQVVVKPFPLFLNKYDLKSRGLSGCSVLGDGSISLIIDVNNLKKD